MVDNNIKISKNPNLGSNKKLIIKLNYVNYNNYFKLINRLSFTLQRRYTNQCCFTMTEISLITDAFLYPQITLFKDKLTYFLFLNFRGKLTEHIASVTCPLESVARGHSGLILPGTAYFRDC